MDLQGRAREGLQAEAVAGLGCDRAAQALALPHPVVRDSAEGPAGKAAGAAVLTEGPGPGRPGAGATEAGGLGATGSWRPGSRGCSRHKPVPQQGHQGWDPIGSGGAEEGPPEQERDALLVATDSAQAGRVGPVSSPPPGLSRGGAHAAARQRAWEVSLRPPAPRKRGVGERGEGENAQGRGNHILATLLTLAFVWKVPLAPICTFQSPKAAWACAGRNTPPRLLPSLSPAPHQAPLASAPGLRPPPLVLGSSVNGQ